MLLTKKWSQLTATFTVFQDRIFGIGKEQIMTFLENRAFFQNVCSDFLWESWILSVFIRDNFWSLVRLSTSQMVGQTGSLPCSYRARLDLEPAYLQVIENYLLTNCSKVSKQKSLQVGSKKSTYNLHLQVVFENPNSTFRLLCITIVRPGPGQVKVRWGSGKGQVRVRRVRFGHEL